MSKTRNLGNLSDVLTAGSTYATGSTPPQFDNSTNIATTAFVQRALGGFSAITVITALPYTVTTAQSGTFFEIGNGLTSGTINIPNPVGNAGIVYTFFNAVGSSFVNIVPASGFISAGSNSYASYQLSTGSSIQLVSEGTNWVLFSGQSTTVIGTSGYQKSPSGLIFQWGTTPAVTQGSSAAVTFPLAFPVGLLCQPMVTPQTGGSNTNGYTLGGGQGGTTGFVVTNNSASSGTVQGSYWAIGH